MSERAPRKWTWHPYERKITAIQVACPFCEAPAGTHCRRGDGLENGEHMERFRLALDVNQGTRTPTGEYR